MIPRLPQEIRRPDSSTMAMLRESRAAIAVRPVDLSAAVYRHLPTFAPRTRAVIAAEMQAHGERIVFALLRAIETLDAMASLEDDLHRLGAEHAIRHGVPAEHYPYIGQALVRAVREMFPGSEGGTLGSAWMEVYEWFAAQMLHGAEAAVPSYLPPRQSDPTSSPAYWRAYVDAEESFEPEDPVRPAEQVDPAATGERTAFDTDDRAELLERLARAEELGASPDVRGQRVLIPGEAEAPLQAEASPVGVPPGGVPPGGGSAGGGQPGGGPAAGGLAGAEPSVEAVAEMPATEAPVPAESELEEPEVEEPGKGESEPSDAHRELPRPGSSSPWPLRAGSPPAVPAQRVPEPQEPTAVGRAQAPQRPAPPNWIEPHGMGTGWPPDPPIKLPRPARPRPEDLGDAPAQE